MDKERLVNFIAAIMEDSGFDILKNYQVANHTIDIYGTLHTSVGEVGVVVACKNYEEPWKVGLDVIKDMEAAAKALRASKIIIFSTSSYTHGSAVYAQKRNIKLVDRKGLIKIAKNYAEKRNIVSEPTVEDEYEYYEPINTKPVSLEPQTGKSRSSGLFKRNKKKSYGVSLNRGGSTYSRNDYYSQSSYSNKRSIPSFNLDISGIFDFFSNHILIYMVLLVIIASIVSYAFSLFTSGPYTGLGRIASSAIICFGGLFLVDRNLSDLLFKGVIIFFISIIISIVTMTL